MFAGWDRLIRHNKQGFPGPVECVDLSARSSGSVPSSRTVSEHSFTAQPKGAGSLWVIFSEVAVSRRLRLGGKRDQLNNRIPKAGASALDCLTKSESTIVTINGALNVEIP
jgi:hypothetical protein